MAANMLKRVQEKRVQQEKKLEVDKKLLGAINRTFSTEDGKKVLYFLMDRCGWLESSIVYDSTGAVKMDAILNNESRRGIYLELRQLIYPEILKDVEFYKPENETQEGGDTE